jgi:cbb3-type cytochrome oxidase maturation protein
MNEATAALTIMTLAIMAIFAGLLVWGIKSRQFHNVEDAKYRMLDDEDSIGGEGDSSQYEEKQP